MSRIILESEKYLIAKRKQELAEQPGPSTINFKLAFAVTSMSIALVFLVACNTNDFNSGVSSFYQFVSNWWFHMIY